MSVDSSKTVAKVTQKSYLAKDFVSFRRDLIKYAKVFFPDKIQDFSEVSLGGLLVELAAYVGDSMSFYLDYQFNELNPITAIEPSNIVMHAKNAGVPIAGAAPAVTELTIYISVPAELSSDGTYRPQNSALPIIKKETQVKSNSGIIFTLVEDCDFAEKDDYGNLLATYVTSEVDDSNNPTTFILTKTATIISGQITNQTFRIPNVLKPFRKITLSNQDVSQIIRVKDSQQNIYHEVESLAEDTVFKAVQNLDDEKELVTSNLEVIPAPYRYIKNTDFRTRITTIQFGSGDASAPDDDIIPDLNVLALPLYGTKTMPRFSIDPNALLRTSTLGISPVNTTIEVIYRHGGGANHNVAPESIRTITSLDILFPENPTSSVKDSVIISLDVKNLVGASGGAAPLTIEGLKSLIQSARNQQARIVTQQDLLARLYTLPNTFGRIFRAGIHHNPDNPLSSNLYVISRDANENLVISPDALKINISKYLNEFRLVSDAVDILDATVINYGINFSVVCAPDSNKSTVIQKVIAAIKSVSDIKYFQIDQPIVESDVINAIINTDGVLSLVELEFINYSGVVGSNTYSDFDWNLAENKHKGLFIGPEGCIFELKYPDSTIIGTAQ